MTQLDWNSAIDTLRKVVPGPQFQNWFAAVRLVRTQESSIVLGVPSRFHGDWLNNHYREKISEILSRQVGQSVQLEFEVLLRDENTLAAKSAPIHPQPALKTPLALPVQSKGVYAPEPDIAPCPAASPDIFEPQIPKFSNAFIETGFNQMAHRFANHFCTTEGAPMGSFGISGSTGMGKSHLLSLIGTQLLKSQPELRIRYVNGETFTTELVQSIKNDKNFAFKQKYRYHTDVLLFDDIHVITKRTRTQEELLHCFNEILGRGGRIAFTCLGSPSKLEDFIDPLKSRLLSSAGAEIKTASEDDRIQLLAHSALQHQIETDDATLKMISEKGSKDIRELLGLMLRVHLQSKLLGRALDTDFLTEEGLAPLTQREAITLDSIIDAVVHTFGIRPEDLFSKSRKANVVWARQVCMFLSRNLTMLPLEEIGKRFDRDHATVIHGYQKVSETIDAQAARRYEVEFIKQRLGICKTSD